MHLLLRLAACSSTAAACLVGCAPALDWRDVHPAGTTLRLQFPCKPIAQQRQLALAGAPVLLSLSACSVGGQTWGLAHADVVDPARVTPALLQLRVSAAANLGNAVTTAEAAAAVQPRPSSSFAGNAALQRAPTTFAAGAAPAPAAPATEPPSSSAPAQVPGLTPNPASVRLRLSGQLPDGKPVEMQLVVFAHGTRVFQATVLGEQVPQAAADNYFASMTLRP